MRSGSLALSLGRPRATRKGVQARGRRELFLMVLPAIVLVLAVNIFPLIYSLWVSFHSYEPLALSHPANGIGNFRQVLSDPLFRSSALLTLIFVAIVVPLQTLLGLGLALLVEMRAWARRIFFPIFLLPVLIMPVVVAYMWRQMWEAPFGVVDEVASVVLRHHVTIQWLNNPRTAFIALVVTEIWQWTPFMFIILLAGIVSVPAELREAAAVDGSGAWSTFAFVVLPSIAGILTIAVMIRLLDAANFFVTVYAITGGAPGTSTFSLVFYIWNLAHVGRFGAASASSFLFLAVLAIFVSVLIPQLMRRQPSAVE